MPNQEPNCPSPVPQLPLCVTSGGILHLPCHMANRGTFLLRLAPEQAEGQGCSNTETATLGSPPRSYRESPPGACGLGPTLIPAWPQKECVGNTVILSSLNCLKSLCLLTRGVSRQWTAVTWAWEWIGIPWAASFPRLVWAKHVCSLPRCRHGASPLSGTSRNLSA